MSNEAPQLETAVGNIKKGTSLTAVALNGHLDFLYAANGVVFTSRFHTAPRTVYIHIYRRAHISIIGKNVKLVVILHGLLLRGRKKKNADVFRSGCSCCQRHCSKA